MQLPCTSFSMVIWVSSFWMVWISKPAANLVKMHRGLIYVERLCFTVWWDNFSPFCVVVRWVVENQNPEAGFLIPKNILVRWRWCGATFTGWCVFPVNKRNGLEATKFPSPSNSDTPRWNLFNSNAFLPFQLAF